MNDKALAKKPNDPSEVVFLPLACKDEIKLSTQIVQRLIAVPTKSGKTCSDRDALRFIALCRARRLNPFEGDCFLIGYDSKDGPAFNLITAHQAFLKRAELDPEYDGMESGVIVEEGEAGKLVELVGDFFDEDLHKLVGAWAKVFHKKRAHPSVQKIHIKPYRKGFGRWLEDPAGMLVKCAEAAALRQAFPTMLGGLYTQEEIGVNKNAIIDIPPPALVTPTPEPTPPDTEGHTEPPATEPPPPDDKEAELL